MRARLDYIAKTRGSLLRRIRERMQPPQQEKPDAPAPVHPSPTQQPQDAPAPTTVQEVKP